MFKIGQNFGAISEPFLQKVRIRTKSPIFGVGGSSDFEGNCKALQYIGPLNPAIYRIRVASVIAFSVRQCINVRL